MTNSNPYDGVPSYGAYNNDPYGQDPNRLVPNNRPGAGRRLGATLIDGVDHRAHLDGDHLADRRGQR
ncbi:hypothetical protein [Corynebacterium sp.]|uniref:hypothetical protein n=1 Tax=Corynebacterium sp. TaxID=1720 RepID=UPI0028A9665E|nr:hypothetical protein [Corynebacterium sp.]